MVKVLSYTVADVCQAHCARFSRLLGGDDFFLLSSVQYILCWGMNSAWFGFLLIGSAIIAVAIFLGLAMYTNTKLDKVQT